MANSKKKKTTALTKKEKKQALQNAAIITAVEGAEQAADGAQLVSAGRDLAGVALQATASAASDLTRAQDAARVAQRVEDIGRVVGAAGEADLAQGIGMMATASDIQALSTAFRALSNDDLDQGLRIGRISGELAIISDAVSLLNMPVLARVLDERSMALEQIGVQVLVQYMLGREMSKALEAKGIEVGAFGVNEAAEGMVRLALSDAAQERAADLDEMSEELAVSGLKSAVEAGEMADAARTVADAGIADIAQGAATVGAGVAMDTIADAA